MQKDNVIRDVKKWRKKSFIRKAMNATLESYEIMFVLSILRLVIY